MFLHDRFRLNSIMARMEKELPRGSIHMSYAESSIQEGTNEG